MKFSLFIFLVISEGTLRFSLIACSALKDRLRFSKDTHLKLTSRLLENLTVI